jgi:hypothetical protein
VSPPDSTEAQPGTYVQKPKADVYTVMLVIALLAIIVAIVCLALELNAYNWELNAPRAELLPKWLGGQLARATLRC